MGKEKYTVEQLEKMLCFVENQILIDEKYLYLNDDMIKAKYEMHKNDKKNLEKELKRLKGEI